MLRNYYLIADPLWLETHPEANLDTGYSAWDLGYRRTQVAGIGDGWVFGNSGGRVIDEDDAQDCRNGVPGVAWPPSKEALNAQRTRLADDVVKSLAVIDSWADQARQRGDDLSFVRADLDWTEIEAVMDNVHEFLNGWDRGSDPSVRWGEADAGFDSMPTDPVWIHWFNTGEFVSTASEWFTYRLDRFLDSGDQLNTIAVTSWQGWPTVASYELRRGTRRGSHEGGWSVDQFDPAMYDWPLNPTENELRAIRDSLSASHGTLLPVIGLWKTQAEANQWSVSDISLSENQQVTDSNGADHDFDEDWRQVEELVNQINVFIGSFGTDGSVTRSAWYDYTTIEAHDPNK